MQRVLRSFTFNLRLSAARSGPSKSLFGKCSPRLLIVVVLVIVIEKPLKAEDEYEDDDEEEGFTGFSKHALSH